MYEKANYPAANLPTIGKYFVHILGKAKFQKRGFNLYKIHYLWTLL